MLTCGEPQQSHPKQLQPARVAEFTLELDTARTRTPWEDAAVIAGTVERRCTLQRCTLCIKRLVLRPLESCILGLRMKPDACVQIEVIWWKRDECRMRWCSLLVIRTTLSSRARQIALLFHGSLFTEQVLFHRPISLFTGMPILSFTGIVAACSSVLLCMSCTKSSRSSSRPVSSCSMRGESCILFAG